MLTFVGCIFIPLGLAIWVLRPRFLLPLAVIASVFHAASVFNIGNFGLPPYYFVAILIALNWPRVIFQDEFVARRVPRVLYPLVAFWLWASVSSVLMPRLFGGLPVLRIESWVEAITFPPVPLAWSYRNIVQVVWLTLNISVVLYAVRVLDAGWIRKAYAVAVGFAVLVLTAQIVLFSLGIRFPLWLFHSNPGYAQYVPGYLGIVRPNGLFSEPSVAAVLFAGLTLAALARFLGGKASIWPLAGTLILDLMMQSAALYLAVAVGGLLLGVVYIPIHKLQLNLSGARRWAALAAVCGAGVLILALMPSAVAAIAANSTDKSSTQSFYIRTASDLACLRYFYQTHGLGVGLGSVRGSSLLPTLIATTGVGVLFFFWFIVKLLRQASPPLRWVFIGGLLAMIIAVPDLSLPTLWANVLLLMPSAKLSAPKALRATMIAAPDSTVRRGQ